MESEIVKKLKQKNVKRGDLVLLVHKGRSKGMSIGIFKNYFSRNISLSNKDAFWLKEGISLYPFYKHPIFGILPNIEREPNLDDFDDISGYGDSEVYVGKKSIIKKLTSRKGFEIYAKMLEGIL